MKKIILGILVIILALGSVGCGRKVKSKTDSELEKQEKKYKSYLNKNVIISAKRAKQIIDKGGNISVIDIRKSGDYKEGHIKNAVNVWRPDYESEKYPFGGMRAEKEKVEKMLGNLGIDSNTFILLYDDKGDYDAARLWWILDMYGHDKSKIALIDGGINGWKASEFKETKEEPKIIKKEYKFKDKTDESKLATLKEVKEGIKDPNTIILDTRSIEEFKGDIKLKGAFRKGRIPSSLWIEYKDALNNKEGEDTTFKNIEELKKIYKAKGITKDKKIIVYCQSAVRSAHTTFVLTQLMGYKNVKNYDGSWIEWSYNKELPIKTGEDD
ncbi:sulfurtransferase [Clostridium oceanicum]|uniref:Sulfurtransferase n=1 Tax=Clostridium oceanicum TaxID=1543 RepID=A0ABN1J893_9CLOT